MSRRPSKRQRELTTVEDFYRIAKEVQNRSGQKIAADETESRRFHEYFGTSVYVAIIAWGLLTEHYLLPEDGGIVHMLWAMHFLCCYPKQEECCAAAGTQEKGAVDPKTWRKYIWPYIYALAELEHVVIDFDSRIVRPDHDTHLSVDCTDCRVPQRGPLFASHKFKGKSALRYEIALGILEGDIKWINGPYPAGRYSDITIFRDCLMTFLEPTERVEADDGYIAESPYTTKCPGAVLARSGEEEDAMQKRVQGRHEMVNARMKFFTILAVPFRHDVTQHGYVFRAVACLVQLSIKNGDPLYDCKYKVVYDEDDDDDE